mmetsp:Transcript_10088/g.34847  ORF Transcript_10088/g.34847 Transcript_10088/m.34847 type:complete len:261 (+) Transcript_10088:1647-2429(+)
MSSKPAKMGSSSSSRLTAHMALTNITMVWPVMLPDPEKSWSISCKPSASKKISNCDVPDRLLYAMSYAIRSNFLMTSTSEPCRAKYWALERHLKTWVHAPCTRLGCLSVMSTRLLNASTLMLSGRVRGKVFASPKPTRSDSLHTSLSHCSFWDVRPVTMMASLMHWMMSLKLSMLTLTLSSESKTSMACLQIVPHIKIAISLFSAEFHTPSALSWCFLMRSLIPSREGRACDAVLSPITRWKGSAFFKTFISGLVMASLF